MKLNPRSACVLLTASLCAAPPSSGQQVPWPKVADVEAGARGGDPAAEVWLGVLLVTGEGDARRDIKGGLKLIQKASDAGHPLAQRLLADILSSGRLVPKNDALALRLYQSAAKAGDPDAQSEMGMRHTLGWGVPRDDAEGVRWATKAAAGGDVAAMLYLASRYEKGRGVEKNSKTAVELFRQAADRGSAQGMCFLGDMYLWGAGVEKSDSDAYRWYVAALAATPAARPIRPVDFVTLTGDYRKNCERNRKQAEKGLNADARTSAEQAAAAWLAKLEYTRIP